MGKKCLICLAVLALVILAIVQIGLWKGQGGLVTFIQGQFTPGPDLAGFSAVSQAPSSIPVEVSVRTDAPVHSVAPEYLSFAIDSSQVVGGKWWNPEGSRVEMGSGTHHAPVFNFNRPLLDRLTRALAPAYLRIGGSEADKIFYDMSGRATLPKGYHSVMTRDQWDQVNAFAERNGLKLVFTVNTGPSARKIDGSWDPANLETLLTYSADKGYEVALWEMGNELNLYWYIYGPSAQVTARQYHQDLKTGRALVKKYFPRSMFSGQGSAYWPLFGEPLTFFFSFMPGYAKTSGDLTDVISWHYYPQQSRRGLIASRRAAPSRLLDPENLNEAAHWGKKIQALRDQYVPGRPVWLGETGNAQFGGEPGLSDRYLAGLWWLDELGLLARTGHDVIVRQTLSGMDYGMIDPRSLDPNPDYWNSLLWKRIMGRDVYDVTVKGTDKVRAYAHNENGSGNRLALLLINLDHETACRIELSGMIPQDRRIYRLGTDDIFSKRLFLNETQMALREGRLPEISARAGDTSELTLAPLSYAFVTGRFP